MWGLKGKHLGTQRDELQLLTQGTESTRIIPCPSSLWKPWHNILRWSINHNWEAEHHKLTLQNGNPWLCSHQICSLAELRGHLSTSEGVTQSAIALWWALLGKWASGLSQPQQVGTQYPPACCATDGGAWGQNQAFRPFVAQRLWTQVEVCAQTCSRNVFPPLLLFSFSVVSYSCNSMDSSPLGSSVRGISQPGILQWVAISFSTGSSWPRDRTTSLHLQHWQVDSLPLSHLRSPGSSLALSQTEHVSNSSVTAEQGQGRRTEHMGELGVWNCQARWSGRTLPLSCKTLEYFSIPEKDIFQCKRKLKFLGLL